MVTHLKKFSVAALLTLSFLAAPMLAHDTSAAPMRSQTCADMLAPSQEGECKGKGKNCCPAVGAVQQCREKDGPNTGPGCGTCKGGPKDKTGIWEVVAGPCLDVPTEETSTPPTRGGVPF